MNEYGDAVDNGTKNIDERKRYECAPNERLALATFVKLARAFESVTNRTHRHIAEAGLTPSQFGVLEALYSLGPLCQKELGAKILKTSGNITMVIDNLEKNGLVRRERSAEDRRYVTVHLTDAGYEIIHRIFPKHAREIAADVSVLTCDEQRALGALLRKLGKRDIA